VRKLKLVLALIFSAGLFRYPGFGRPFKSLGEQIYHAGIGIIAFPSRFYGGPM
jgi:hypothetical protein